MNGKRVTKQDSTYQFARLDEYTKGNREPIFAWSKKKKDGEFGCANFGTRYDFDCIIVDSHCCPLKNQNSSLKLL